MEKYAGGKRTRVVRVIRTDEERVIANTVRRVLDPDVSAKGNES